MVRSLLPLCTAAITLAASSASAQQDAPRLAPDQRIRITVPGEGGLRRVAGTIIEMSADTVLLEVRGTQEKVARSSIETLELSRGAGSRTRYAALGGVIGTAVGAGLGLYLRENSHERAVLRFRDRCTDPKDPSTCVRESYTSEEKAPLFTTVGVSLAGTAVGGLVGALLPGDRWEVMPLSNAPGTRTTLSLSVSLRR